MNNNFSRNLIIYLANEIGLDESSIELGLKLSSLCINDYSFVLFNS